MNEPESHPPEGAHMGTFMEDAHRTAIDLEDTAARMRRYEFTLQMIVLYYEDHDGDLDDPVYKAARKALYPD